MASNKNISLLELIYVSEFSVGGKEEWKQDGNKLQVTIQRRKK